MNKLANIKKRLCIAANLLNFLVLKMQVFSGASAQHKCWEFVMSMIEWSAYKLIQLCLWWAKRQIKKPKIYVTQIQSVMFKAIRNRKKEFLRHLLRETLLVPFSCISIRALEWGLIHSLKRSPQNSNNSLTSLFFWLTFIRLPSMQDT